ncbi:MAG: hypothetical protein K0U86_18635 [Planctomycetes bacterium]|nr:hypothetical protein [Planctomycetota bacterium]MCH9726925.1 hypothetical protein [Planctomycetota bacterium]MCH9775609.1 hypothetical protein [Planctomycetota bacterium]MCH9793621.1 hypothetical protein [Planctomycetota bacterium]
MDDLILNVNDIAERHRGKTIRIKGMLYSHDFVCWLVPPNTKRSMDSKKHGILVILPGLGAEVLESELSRTTSGRPMVSVEEVELLGRLISSQNDEYKAVIDNIELVIFRTGMNESTLNLKNIQNIANFKQSMIDSLDDETARERYRQQCENERHT